MIEDILMCTYGQFTVNNAVANVPVVAPAAGADIFRPGAAYPPYYFQPKDNFIIKSISLNLPYAFVSADQLGEVLIFGVPAGGADFVLPELGVTSLQVYHSENVDIDRNIYIAHTKAFKFGLRGQMPVTAWKVCCLNTPAVLNATVQPVFCTIRILHNLAMIP